MLLRAREWKISFVRGRKRKVSFLGEILDEKLWELFVTPKEIDEAVKRISYTLSEGINQFVAGRIF